MKRVAIVSDSHVPSREAALPGWVRAEVTRADHTIHAGDVDARESLDEIADIAAGFTAVKGNTDPESMELPITARVEVEDVEFVVTHGIGGGTYYRNQVVARVLEAAGTPGAIGISGHTHEPHDLTMEGTRFLNPGSCTGAWPTDDATMMVAEVEADDLSVEVVSGPSGE